MTKPPLATAITTLLTVVMPVSLISPAFAGDVSTSRPARMISSTSVAENEVNRRHEEMERGLQHLDNGDRAMKARDYEKAFAEYKAACDNIPNASNTSRLYGRALHSFCDAAVSLAEQRIAEGRYGDAEATLKTVLAENYDPHCRRAINVLAHLEEPDYYNKTITPRFRANVEQVKQWFVEAKGYYDSGRYDLAFKRCEQILGADPTNSAARKFEEEIDRKRDDFAVESYNETRARQMWQVSKGWAMPVRRYDAHISNIIDQGNTQAGRSQIIQRKLNSIILPRLEFREATIREAIDFLKKKSTELDLPTHEGVNIVLKIGDAGGGDVAAAVAAPAGAPVIPGLEPVPGAAPAAAPVAGGASVNPGDARITVSLTNIPLGEALKYVTSLANLKYKVEDYAISVVPLSTVTEVMLNREWKVPPGLLTGPGAQGGASGLTAPTAGAAPGGAANDATRGGTGIAARVDAKDFLSASGVTFPPGSSAIYLASSSKLIVKNTPEQLDLVDAIVQAASVNQPVQVEIESKFVEIQQDNLKELGFDWLLGQANIPGSNKVFVGGGTTGSATGVSTQNYPFPVGGGSSQTFPVTQSLRTGSLAISQNAIDALLAGTSGGAMASPAVAAIAGVFTDPQFQVVIHALNQKKGIDLLSAPRVTTKSGQRAVIEIIREFRYPTEFEPPQIPQTFGNQAQTVSLNPLANNSSSGSFPVTPTTPTAFETRNTGVTLEVEPVIGPDGQTIDLNLVPQVVEFEGFVNYGSPIQTTSTNPLTGAQTVNVITPNVINQPIFSTRKVTTSVSVYDGNTVVLGGLMREDVQKTEDKIPLIGDMPIFGRLFRSQTEQHLKTNLVIFVSARLINPAGDAVHSDEETEEIVQTLPTPEVSEPQLPLMSK